nr:ATPase, T2SS/T4P/T4SS family [Burkholderiales bacterium]
MPKRSELQLGPLLLQENLLTEDELERALEQQKKTGQRLGRILVGQGILSEEQISMVLAAQFGIPYVNLNFYHIPPETAVLLSESQSRRYKALVLEERPDSVLVGMADPTDLLAFDAVGRILNRTVETAAVDETKLIQAIDRLYRRTEEITGLARELEKDLRETYVDFGALTAAAAAEEAPVVKLLQSMFQDAIQARASDIHIEPQERKLAIRFRIDGVLYPQTESDIKVASALALRLKLASGLDISEKRLPQDGRFNVRVRQQQVDVRISTMPTQNGESIVMRLLPQGGGILSLEKLGMPSEMLDEYRRIIHRPNGLVLVTGPTGSGKTTTLYATLAELNTTECKIISVEDPIEYRLPGINQVQVNEKIELTFSRVLRSVLRHDPDIILIGEMRDHETAQIGLRAAMTGHLVLSTLHTNDAASTPIRLLDMEIPKYMVAA